MAEKRYKSKKRFHPIEANEAVDRLLETIKDRTGIPKRRIVVDTLTECLPIKYAKELAPYTRPEVEW